MIAATFCVLALLGLAYGSNINVIASVRGKKYEIEAETVADFTAKVESVVNLEAGQQSVLFRGKVLAPTDVLSDVGVASGDVLMVVKGRRLRAKQELDAETNGVDVAQNDIGRDAGPYSKGLPKDPSEMEAAMKQMDNLLDSNVLDEYFKDDESLEKARLQLLDNLDQYEKAMPGFRAQAEDIASDPVKWRTAMSKARDQINLLREQREKLRQSGAPSNAFPTSKQQESQNAPKEEAAEKNQFLGDDLQRFVNPI